MLFPVFLAFLGGWTGVFQYNFTGNEGGPAPAAMQTVTGTPGPASNYMANAEGVFAATGASQMLLKETSAGTPRGCGSTASRRGSSATSGTCRATARGR